MLFFSKFYAVLFFFIFDNHVETFENVIKLKLETLLFIIFVVRRCLS